MDNQELSGGDWFINNLEFSSDIIYLGESQPFRYKDALLGYSYPYHDYYLIPPDHFGYENNTYIDQSFDTNFNISLNNKYMIINTQYILSLYDTGGLYSKIGRYKEEDFIKLGNDPTVNELYDNGEMNVYYIK